MAGKKSGKALLREEGLARTDNGFKQTSWPETPMINQKNYYTYVVPNSGLSRSPF
jgi:actin-related protein 8